MIKDAIPLTHDGARPTIGVFDSGFGGLTVLKALLELIPGADYIYFGDTARLPYGSKSVETVARYAVEAAHYLEGSWAPSSW
jgi:glutamate racemase